MKNLIVIFMFAAFAITGLHAKNKPSISVFKTVIVDGTDQFTVKVDGLGCAYCAYGLEKKFKELKNIKKIGIELETGMLTFLMPSDSQFSLEEVAKQVANAGYTFINGEVVRANGTVEHLMQNQPESTEAANDLAFEAIKVSGNCGMCKATIEKAALSVEGVKTADWNIETNVLILEFDKHIVSLEAIEKAIAKTGYETEHINANTDAYDNLPTCCKYKE